MNNLYTINIAEAVAPIVASRDAVATLREKIENVSDNTVQLDMAKVQFVSRSAAHEFLTLKEYFALQTPKKEVEFISSNEAVATMLRVVASNRAVPKEKPKAADIKKVSIEDLEVRSRSPLQFLKRLFAH